MAKNFAPSPGGDPREAEGAPLPAALQLGDRPSPEELTLLGAGGSKANRDCKNHIQLLSSLIFANVYFHSLKSAIAAMVNDLEIYYIMILKAHLNKKVQPTVLAKNLKYSQITPPPTFPLSLSDTMT